MAVLRSIMLLALVAVAAAEVSGSLSKAAEEPTTPVGKVIDLLETLVSDIETEGKTEAGTYDTFACFCKTQTEKKSKSIKDGRDTIDTESTHIEKKTAQRAEDRTELQDRKVKEEQYDQDLTDEKARCAKEDASFDSNSTDLDTAIRGLNDAIDAMELSKPVVMPTLLQKTFKAAAAHTKSVNTQHNVRSLLSTRLRVDPEDPEYKYHSDGIIGMLKKLRDDFTSSKESLDGDWKAAKKACTDTQTSIQGQIDENDGEMKKLDKSISDLTGEIANHRKTLVTDEIDLKEDELYLKDLTDRCEIRAKDWDQRSNQRSAELTALNGALDLMKNNVSGADAEVNKRTIELEDDAGEKPTIEELHGAGLLQKNAAPTGQKVKPQNVTSTTGQKDHVAHSAPVFLQDAAVTHKSHSVLRGSGKVGLSMKARQEKVLTLLRSRGAQLQSTALSTLAARTEKEMEVARDPFTKVKRLIQELVERLLAESTAEATKKGFCDESLKVARTDRDFRYSEVKKLASDYMSLDIKGEELNAEIEMLTDDLQTLTWALGNATDTFNADKDEMTTAINKAKEGLNAVKMAITILKDFYRKASRARDPKAAVLLQESPVKENAAQGAYRGNQDAAAGIIGMMEVIKSDFDRTVSTTEDALARTTVEFVKFDRASKADIGGKETKRSLDMADLKKTLHKKNETKTDLKSNMNLLDQAFKELVQLKPVCIDSGMSYEDRVAKREEEIKALKEALCFLDADPSVEVQDCSNGKPVV